MIQQRELFIARQRLIAYRKPRSAAAFRERVQATIEAFMPEGNRRGNRAQDKPLRPGSAEDFPLCNSKTL